MSLSPKGMKKVEAWLDDDDFDGPLDDIIEMLKDASKGLSDVRLEHVPWGSGFKLFGYRPMTAAEKASALKKSERAKAAAEKRAEKKLQEKRRLLERLKAELGE